MTHPDVTNINFDSDHTLLDAELVILDAYPFYQRCLQAAKYSPKIGLERGEADFLLSWFQRRAIQLYEFFRLGRTAVVIVRKFPKVSVLHYENADVNKFMPRKVDRLTQDFGTNIVCLDEEPFVTFLYETMEVISYNSVFNSPIGKPIFFINGTERVVGSLETRDRGNCLYLPALQSGQRLAEKGLGVQTVESLYVNSIVSLVEKLSGPISELELPFWHKEVLVPGETAAIKSVIELKEKRDSLESQIREQESALGELESCKLLFTGTGQPLLEQVRAILAEIGFDVDYGDEGRDDLVANFGDMEFVVEVKGKGGSAAERDAAQLSKWVAGHLEKYERHAKGLLIVNAFKDELPKERVHTAFPDQMLKYSGQQQLCLMTGFQLLGIYFHLKENPEKRDDLINHIFSTVGVYPDFQNYTDFLEELTVDEEEEKI